MRSLGGRVARRLGSLLVTLLLLLPVLASGHHHGTDAARAPDDCALCMVKSDSPAVPAAPVPLLAPLLHCFAAPPTALAAPGFAYRPLQAARAPPRPLSIRRA
jgi:hypothetical protein